MVKIIDIIKDLYSFDYSVAGEGNDKALKKFKEYLKFKIHNFSSNKSLNGWKIPGAEKVIVGDIFYKKKKF